MHIEILDILRCPFCGGRLELVTSLFHRAAGDRIHDGILGCHCCIFPIVDGIPVVHLQPAAVQAREQVEAGHPELARRTMIGLDASQAEQFESAAAADTSTYRDMVDAIGPGFEGGYFLYRFSDPTYLVANAGVRSVARTVLRGGRRAVDICGGSGHLTRSLVDLSSPPPVLADLYFAKVWLARRFTVPGCEAVCCDANAPMPFARGAFGFAMCSDAFQYIWTKRQFVGELCRLVDAGEPGAVMISHTHNQLTWSPSHGQPLSPSGYIDLFETIPPRIYGETALLDDVLGGKSLDFGRQESIETLNGEPALTIVASKAPEIYRHHPLDGPAALPGAYRINPLYHVEPTGERLRLSLRFPDSEYESEYGACRRYLPDDITIDRMDLAALEAGARNETLTSLLEQRVVLTLPERWY